MTSRFTVRFPRSLEQDIVRIKRVEFFNALLIVLQDPQLGCVYVAIIIPSVAIVRTESRRRARGRVLPVQVQVHFCHVLDACSMQHHMHFLPTTKLFWVSPGDTQNLIPASACYYRATAYTCNVHEACSTSTSLNHDHFKPATTPVPHWPANLNASQMPWARPGRAWKHPFVSLISIRISLL